MDQFDEYIEPLTRFPEEALVFEELGEPGQSFVLSLRGALKRNGLTATVRKMRGRDEVRVWLVDDEEAQPEPEIAPVKRGGRGRKAG